MGDFNIVRMTIDFKLKTIIYLPVNLYYYTNSVLKVMGKLKIKQQQNSYY